MRFRKRQRPESTDFRKVSEVIHERRTERAGNPETLRQNPESAEAAVRTYRPEQRLRSVDRETQQLVEDASDIPRTWDPDRPPPQPWIFEWSSAFIFVGSFFASLYCTALLALAPHETVEDRVTWASLTVACMAVLAITSIAYFRKLGVVAWVAWVGLTVCTAELVAFLIFVSRW
jgi:hypothetical protein